LVWIKSRTANYHALFDTVRGSTTFLKSNATDANETRASSLTSFNTDGFSLSTWGDTNGSGTNFASWTFRKQPKFFDVVTWTGNDVDGRVINHSLASTVGCIIWKQTSNTYAGEHWGVWHRSLTGTNGLWLDLTNAQSSLGRIQATSSSTFTVSNNTEINGSGATYVAYLFAHNAGGFGLTGTDNVISCGSVTANGSGVASINLGYEPQWIMLKNITSADSWYIYDNMRGLYAPTTLSPTLRANITNAEVDSGASPRPNATGVSWTAGDTVLTASNTYIYIAIRRGPMQIPTSGTSVFAPQVYNGSASTPAFTGLTFPPDTAIQLYKTGGAAAEGQVFGSKLQGPAKLQASSTVVEASEPDFIYFQNGFRNGTATTAYAAEMFRRAPSFHDVICYTGTGVTSRVLNHNLTVTPEMIIYKTRTLAGEFWGVYTASTGIGNVTWLNRTNATSAQGQRTLAVSSTTITVGDNSEVNGSGTNYVAYLFATCAGVSKVGSYTGTGALQTVNCGFTSGARFVLIKRTDSTGDWWVFDSARGITSGNDPYILFNSATAEVTSTNYVDTDSTGFKVTAAAPAGLNASGGTYIFLAIA
jgi:hypothetical protein